MKDRDTEQNRYQVKTASTSFLEVGLRYKIIKLEPGVNRNLKRFRLEDYTIFGYFSDAMKAEKVAALLNIAEDGNQ